MRDFKKYFFLAIFLIVSSKMSFGQIVLNADTPEGMLYIPGVYTLIDSAIVYSPLLHTKDIDIELRKMKMRVQRFEWTNFIQPFSEYRYGTIDNVVFSQSGLAIDAGGTKAHRFNVGARINLTLFNAIDWRYKIKQYEKEIELDESRRKEIELSIAKEVITLWNMLNTYRSIVFLKSDHMITQMKNGDEAKLMYETGEIPLMELSRITEIATKSQEEYTFALKELRESLYMLMEIVGREDFTTWGNY